MKIKYGVYTIEPENRAYNLFKDVTSIRKKTKEKYISQINLGWSMTFEVCLEKIIADSLADKDETFTIRQYIDEFKEMKDKLLCEVNF